MLLPQGIGALFTRTLTDRYGGRIVACAGFTTCVISTIPFLIPDLSSSSLLYPLLFIRGLAIGMLIVPVTTSVFVGLADMAVSRATVIVRAFQQIGGSFGTAAGAVCASWFPRHEKTAS